MEIKWDTTGYTAKLEDAWLHIDARGKYFHWMAWSDPMTLMHEETTDTLEQAMKDATDWYIKNVRKPK